MKHFTFKQSAGLDLSVPSTNKLGQYLDPWKAPYKFYGNAANITIHSAGSNKVVGDSDDVALTSTNFLR